MKSMVCRFLVLTLVILVPALAGAVTIGFDPAMGMAMPRDTLFVDLVIAGLGAGGAPSLGVFDIDIVFDAGALTFVDFALTDSLGDDFDPGFGNAFDTSGGDLGLGIANVGIVSLLLDFELDLLQSNTFPLVTFEFIVDVLPPGADTTIGVDSIDALGDSFGFDLLPLAGAPGTALIENPPGGPGPGIPEPGTLALLGVGLAAAWARRRQPKR